MNTSLINQIKRRIEEKGLSVRALERHAGLGLHAVTNILSGRSKKPSADMLSAIAQALDCTVDELLGNKNIQPIFSPNNKDKKFQDPKILFEIMGFFTREHCEKIKNLSYYNFLKCVVIVYEYIISKNDGVFNKSFAEWELERVIKEQNKH